MCTNDEIKLGLQQEKGRKNEVSASENVNNFFSANQPYIEKCYEYYKNYDSNKANYIDQRCKSDVEKLQSMCRGKTILVITANPIEEGVLLHGLSDASTSKLGFFIIGNFPYHVCKIGEYTIVHTHAPRTGVEMTRRTINAATRHVEPTAIVLLGICYGLDFDKNQLGDVLISDTLKNFRLNFRDSDSSDETIFEAEAEDSFGVSTEPRVGLQNGVKANLQYRNIFSIIHNERDSLRDIKCDMGAILSANCLMSSKKVKMAVLRAFGNVKPKPLGGEMEGGGLLNSEILENGFNNWIVMKSICDWGEKKNLLSSDPETSEKMKDAIQAMAMVHSWSVFYEMIKQSVF